jgi:hypothetical protein
VNSARLTDTDIRDGVAALSTNVPLNAVGMALGGLMMDGEGVGDGEPTVDEAGGWLEITGEALVDPGDGCVALALPPVQAVVMSARTPTTGIHSGADLRLPLRARASGPTDSRHIGPSMRQRPKRPRRNAAISHQPR